MEPIDTHNPWLDSAENGAPAGKAAQVAGMTLGVLTVALCGLFVLLFKIYLWVLSWFAHAGIRVLETAGQMENDEDDRVVNMWNIGYDEYLRDPVSWEARWGD